MTHQRPPPQAVSNQWGFVPAGHPKNFSKNPTEFAGQWSSTTFMPLAPKVQDLHESFFRPLQFLEKADIPASVKSRQVRSLRRVKFRQRSEIRTSASSLMLTELRIHFRANFVTASKREKMEGIKCCRSDWALRESSMTALSFSPQPPPANKRAVFPVIGAKKLENASQTLVGQN
ncbi:hypothetical protein F3Y22_tig00112801pilonHSYRG00102 [Hibiscus syriacus]|uniref:Uncharacterized protein n=1 Tax=Hibiscus syriacus TaxID=106335 RepID=A0A6A2X5T1_HIBSY|nr:hypothetical protein F3Y22_tig00112801pilonHSYRG00102 [Hibiscus syriacus]